MDDAICETPAALAEIGRRTAALGFDMPSEPRTGAFLKALAASKPGGRILELGTGTGLATAWLLAGMDSAARMVSVENDAKVQAVARAALGGDRRVSFVLDDGLAFLASAERGSFDLVFADAWPGKYDGLDEALSLVRPGGFYVGDDMLPQANWPEGHQANVDGLIADLKARPGWAVVALAWASGLVMAVRHAESGAGGPRGGDRRPTPKN